MFAACLALALAAAPAPPPPRGPPGSPPSMGAAPPPADMARLYFLAGDLASATDVCRRASKLDPKRCPPMVKALAEYAFLAPKRDELTPEQARAYLAWDRAISPGTPGKLTEGVLRRFVRGPLALAQARREAGDGEGALELVSDVLTVDPKNAEALAQKKDLLNPGRDGGVPARDGGAPPRPPH